MRASFLSPWCLLCEHCESGIKYLPHWVLLKKVNDFGQLYYLPQTLHCPIAVLSETCALASRPELLDPMELMLRRHTGQLKNCMTEKPGMTGMGRDDQYVAQCVGLTVRLWSTLK